MTRLTDDDLMILHREGDAQAFDVLFDLHYAAVYNFAYMLLHDAHQSADVLQETFLTVVRRAGDYLPRGHFKTYILRICRNRCFNIIETNRNRQRITMENGFELVRSVSSSPEPDKSYDRDERLVRVRDAMRELPERQREAITLYAYESMSYNQIADVLGMPVNSVKTLIHRARQRLAGVLKDGAGE